MKFGMFFIASSPEGNHERDVQDLLTQVEYAEELGFDSIWLAEHHSSYGIIGSPAVLLAAIAERTSRIRIGCAVSVLPFSNPVRIAEDYAMVDNLSGGRFDFGIGRGNQPMEYHMMQADMRTSKEVFWESVDIIMSLWGESSTTYDGEHYRFKGISSFPKPVQARIPTWIAAMSPETFAAAAERDIQIMTTGPGSDPEGFRMRLENAANLLVERGRPRADIEFPMAMDTYIASSPARARDEFKHAVQVMHELIPVDPFAGVPREVPDYILEGRADSALDEDKRIDALIARRSVMATDPDGATLFLKDMEQSFGLKHFICATSKGGLSHESAMTSMKLFAEEVMPAFR